MELSIGQLLVATFAVALSTSIAVIFAAFKLFLKDEAKKALKDDLEELRKQINLKQSKELCTVHHHNLDQRLEAMDKKLDKLLEK